MFLQANFWFNCCLITFQSYSMLILGFFPFSMDSISFFIFLRSLVSSSSYYSNFKFYFLIQNGILTWPRPVFGWNQSEMVRISWFRSEPYTMLFAGFGSKFSTCRITHETWLFSSFTLTVVLFEIRRQSTQSQQC